MNEIFEKVIDYSLFQIFDKELLLKSLIVPIKKEGIYFEYFSCKESDYSLLNLQVIPREILITKDEINFFLSDFDLRKKLFNLSISSQKNNDNETNHLDEFFYSFINKAIVSRVSDIHIETMTKALCIRFRIDGSLKLFYTFEKNFMKSLSSYIKMISKLDVTNFRTAMDGRFSLYIKEEKYDFRVSIIPTINGESIVIRILDNKTVSKEINKLGFSKNILDSFDEIKKIRQGLVLITGPTGSGKSTTLYSLLKELSSSSKKVITIEDPVEYKLELIQQIEVNEEIGLGFQTVLRNILRQDPDIILIGEIRDTTSLSIALQASLTGHLVLASLHANNCIESLSRLLDLKADRFLLSNSLKYIFSQRLVLNICKDCNKVGCSKCNFTGFYGRSSISEVLKIDENVSSKILNNESIKEYLKTLNFKTMYEDGLQKVKENITTLEEVLKVVEKV